ncbi:hypothetical protein [Pseudomonas fragi]|uniref:hypothetical protein n=1 Tax=Pseudomonas fragi TaxID=296 RepID=UPI001473B878|nr:hypothetical protein [Pseudomonas fragi]NNB54235.1 hypothetical protein [Pseudomonas fragi]
MNNEQAKILSRQVVSEIFVQIFAAEDEEPIAGVAVIGWPRKLSEEELSRRIDAAVALSIEKLIKINSDS